MVHKTDIIFSQSDDLALHARSPELFRQLSKQQLSIKLATTVGHFFRDVDIANVYMA